jgi:FkbM family methyltransferase
VAWHKSSDVRRLPAAWDNRRHGRRRAPHLPGTINQMKQRLESRLPGLFRHNEITVSVDIGGIQLTLRDWEGSNVLAIVPKEILDDDYRLTAIDFRPGDVVIDVGANIGIVALYLAKKYPDIRIVAIEPVPTTFRHLQENIEANGVRNITALNCAITTDSRDLQMIVNPGHSGGSTGHLRNLKQPGHYNLTVKSRTLDSIFDEYVADRCRLLKIDCEGAEYEILSSARCLDRVDHLGIEIHHNQFLASQGHTPEGLLREVSRSIPMERIAYTTTPMFDH